MDKTCGWAASIALVITPFARPAHAGVAAPSAPVGGEVQDLYRFDTPVTVEGWRPSDDRVMGGISRSRLRHDTQGHAVFEGTMSLEQNGGFASVRAEAQAQPKATVTHYVLEVRGDGKRYLLNMRMSGAFDGVSYQAGFETVANTWTTVRLPVSLFAPTFRGQRVVNAPPLDPAAVRQFGLMITDKQDGRFALDIRRISVALR